MLTAPLLAVRYSLADLLPARSRRRDLAVALLVLGCWHVLPNHATLAQKLDATTHQVWQLVEVNE